LILTKYRVKRTEEVHPMKALQEPALHREMGIKRENHLSHAASAYLFQGAHSSGDEICCCHVGSSYLPAGRKSSINCRDECKYIYLSIMHVKIVQILYISKVI
jgi:hypothetical protein